MRYFALFIVVAAINLMAKQCHNAHQDAVKDATKKKDSVSVALPSKPLDTTFTLQVSQSITLPANSVLSFSKLDHDSRCPKGASCIWEGEASIRLRYTSGNIDSTFSLSTLEDPHHHKAILINGLNIIFSTLSPYPATNIKIDPRGYTAGLTVHKN